MGGVEEFTKNMAKALASKGCEITVVTNDTNNVGAGLSREDGLDVMRLPCLTLLGGRFPVPLFSRKWIALYRTLRGSHFDGVIVNTRFYPHSVMGMRLARHNGIRPVVIEHGSSYLSLGSPVLNAVERVYERAITSLGKAFKPSYYGVSKRSVSWLREFSISANGVIPNSIDSREYRSLASDRQWRRELDIDDSVFLLVYAGRLIEEKGLGVLLDAMKLLCPDNDTYQLVIAGSGPLEGFAKDAESSYCRFAGRLSREDLSSLLKEADCICLPTRYPEGLPTILLEGAAQHAAIVVSDCAGAREVVPSRAYGTVLVDVSASSVAVAIKELREDEARLQQCKEAAAKRVEAEFSWNETADKLLAAVSSN